MSLLLFTYIIPITHIVLSSGAVEQWITHSLSMVKFQAFHHKFMPIYLAKKDSYISYWIFSLFFIFLYFYSFLFFIFILSYTYSFIPSSLFILLYFHSLTIIKLAEHFFKFFFYPVSMIKCVNYVHLKLVTNYCKTFFTMWNIFHISSETNIIITMFYL